MIIFPLSIPGKIILILIAVVLGLIFSMIQWPQFWKNLLRKKEVVKDENNKTDKK